MSKSLPESSTFGEQAEEFETESGYEVVGEVRRKALAMVTNEEDDVASSISNRGALPLPDEEDGAKETPKDVDDMYAKIIKHSTVKSKVVEVCVCVILFYFEKKQYTCNLKILKIEKLIKFENLLFVEFTRMF